MNLMPDLVSSSQRMLYCAIRARIYCSYTENEKKALLGTVSENLLFKKKKKRVIDARGDRYIIVLALSARMAFFREACVGKSPTSLLFTGRGCGGC